MFANDQTDGADRIEEKQLIYQYSARGDCSEIFFLCRQTNVPQTIYCLLAANTSSFDLYCTVGELLHEVSDVSTDQIPSKRDQLCILLRNQTNFVDPTGRISKFIELYGRACIPAKALQA